MLLSYLLFQMSLSSRPNLRNSRSSVNLERVLTDVAGPVFEMVANEVIHRGAPLVTHPEVDEGRPEHDQSRPPAISRRRFVINQCNGLAIAVLFCMSAFWYLLAQNQDITTFITLLLDYQKRRNCVAESDNKVSHVTEVNHHTSSSSSGSWFIQAEDGDNDRGNMTGD